MGYFARCSEAKISIIKIEKIWSEGNMQARQRQEVPSDSPLMARLKKMIMDAKSLEEFYPVDPSRPTFFMRVFDGENEEIIRADGRYFALVDKTIWEVTQRGFVSLLNEIVKGAPIKKQTLDEILTSLSTIEA